MKILPVQKTVRLIYMLCISLNPRLTQGVDMDKFHISFMEQNDIPIAAKVLSISMLNNPLHIGVFLGNGENERLEIEKMFFKLLNDLPGIVFLAKENNKIIGVMRMKSCIGKVFDDSDVVEDENDIVWRKSVLFKEWAERDPVEQHWHLGPIGVLPTHRGLGVGTALMQRFCKEVDNCSAKAYLETDLDKNVRFYEKFGFKVISSSRIFHVENKYMSREANPNNGITHRSA